MAKAKEEAEKAKKEKDKDRKTGTSPSHPLDDYVGDYEHPVYGTITVEKEGTQLKAKFNSMSFLLNHYHYNVFEFKNEFLNMEQKVSFDTDLKGNILSLAIQLEPAVKEIVFNRAPEKKMMERGFLEEFTGQYEFSGVVVTVSVRGERTLVQAAGFMPQLILARTLVRTR